jgi:hypothetical protein
MKTTVFVILLVLSVLIGAEVGIWQHSVGAGATAATLMDYVTMALYAFVKD